MLFAVAVVAVLGIELRSLVRAKQELYLPLSHIPSPPLLDFGLAWDSPPTFSF